MLNSDFCKRFLHRAALPFVALTLGLAMAAPASLHADTVTLKNGNEYTNVRTFLQSGHVSIIQRDGQILTIPVSQLRRIKRRPVDWDPGMSEAEFEERMAAELDRAVAERKAQEESFRTGALWRSAIIPGWGQYYKNEPWKAGIFAGAFVLGLVATYSADQDFRAARDEDRFRRELNRLSYIALANPQTGTPDLRAPTLLLAEQSTAAAKDAGQSAFNLAILTGLFYAFNLIDARFLGSVESLGLEPGDANAAAARGGFEFYAVERSFASGPSRNVANDFRERDAEAGVIFRWRF